MNNIISRLYAIIQRISYIIFFIIYFSLWNVQCKTININFFDNSLLFSSLLNHAIISFRTLTFHYLEMARKQRDIGPYPPKTNEIWSQIMFSQMIYSWLNSQSIKWIINFRKWMNWLGKSGIKRSDNDEFILSGVFTFSGSTNSSIFQSWVEISKRLKGG